MVGTSCAGKTTLSRELARLTGGDHVELDTLFWGPGWEPAPREQFRQTVSLALAGQRWIVDGNYRPVQDLVLERATAVVWLDLSFPLVFTRALARTVRRVVLREELFSGNRETFTQSFLTRDSILWWVVTTFHRRRRRYAELFAGEAWPHLQVFRLQRPGQAKALLESFRG